MRSFIYSSRIIYGLLMRMLYMGAFHDRFERVASWVDNADSVLELCFGDLYLYTHYLKQKQVSYQGIDLAPAFVAHGRKLGVNVFQGDVTHTVLPRADVVIMQASLYQFIDQDLQLMNKLFNAARKRIIIAEPVRNIAQSSNKVVSFCAKYLVNSGVGHHTQRYNMTSLQALIERFIKDNKEQIKSVVFEEIQGGREVVVAITKQI